MINGFFPQRAIDDDTQNQLEALRQLADHWGLDITQDLKSFEKIDDKMNQRGPGYGRN